MHQHESAIGIHMSPPSWNSLQPPIPSHTFKLSQTIKLSSLCYRATYCFSFKINVYCLFAPSLSQSSVSVSFSIQIIMIFTFGGRLVELGHNILCHTLQFCLLDLHLNTLILYNVNSNSDTIWFKKKSHLWKIYHYHHN